MKDVESRHLERWPFVGEKKASRRASLHVFCRILGQLRQALRSSRSKVRLKPTSPRANSPSLIAKKH